MLEFKYFKIQKGVTTTPNIIKNWDKFNIMLQNIVKQRNSKDGNIPV